jgi:hypothetical protein
MNSRRHGEEQHLSSNIPFTVRKGERTFAITILSATHNDKNITKSRYKTHRKSDLGDELYSRMRAETNWRAAQIDTQRRNAYVDLYKIATEPTNVGSPPNTARNYRNYIKSLPPELSSNLEPYALRTECTVAEILAGDAEQAEKDLTELEARIYPYNNDRLLESDIRGAKCEQQTTSDVFKKQIREIVARLQQPRKLA